MAIHTKGRAVRRQITLSPEIDAQLRHLATERGQSRSAVVAQAIRELDQPSAQISKMLAFAGSIKGGGSQPLGRMVDDVLYGDGPHPIDE